MSDAAKRAEVADMYQGPRWKSRVAKMTDSQVYAIWARQQEKLTTQEEEQKDEADPTIPF